MQNIIFLPLEKVFKIKPACVKSWFQKSWKKSFFSRNPGKKSFFPEILEKKYSGYAAILENKKRGEEELHKLEWAPRNEKWAHWNKNRSKGKKLQKLVFQANVVNKTQDANSGHTIQKETSVIWKRLTRDWSQGNMVTFQAPVAAIFLKVTSVVCLYRPDDTLLIFNPLINNPYKKMLTTKIVNKMALLQKESLIDF